MSDLYTEIEGCRVAHEKLATILTQVSAEQIGDSTLLPAWTVGHVLSHLARNAEAMSRRIEGALRDEVVEQYPGGASGRAAAIEAGAARSAENILRDVRDTASQLDRLFASVPEAAWSKPVRTVAGGEHPMSMLPFRRWREVEVHLVDLKLGATPADWPPELVDRALPRLLQTLGSRCDRTALTAWLLGRGEAPEIATWA